MIDEPDRAEPRFPAFLEPAVAERIEVMFDGLGIGIHDLVICGGARGADILFAESAHRRKAAVELHLALPPAEFEQTSVALPRSIWTARFRYLVERYLASTITEGGVPRDEANEGPFSTVNNRLFARAKALCPPASLSVALVWDEQPAGRRGGTEDVAQVATSLGVEPLIVNPLHL
jgi:hypothetical protein